MDTPALAASDVVVERGGDRILDGVSLTVPRASRTLIKGRSGVGKSTLFEVLGLLDVPDSGTIRVAGEDAAALSERERSRVRRNHVGIVFQEFQLLSDRTAWENARLPQEHAGEYDEAWLTSVFDDLGIADKRDQHPPKLSGGEKQRVAIARALANRPDVVLADEPTGQLDPETAARVLKLLVELQATSETALVVVSHDPTIADQFDDIVRLVDGTIVDA